MIKSLKALFLIYLLHGVCVVCKSNAFLALLFVYLEFACRLTFCVTYFLVVIFIKGKEEQVVLIYITIEFLYVRYDT